MEIECGYQESEVGTWAEYSWEGDGNQEACQIGEAWASTTWSLDCGFKLGRNRAKLMIMHAMLETYHWKVCLCCETKGCFVFFNHVLDLLNCNFHKAYIHLFVQSYNKYLTIPAICQAPGSSSSTVVNETNMNFVIIEPSIGGGERH